MLCGLSVLGLAGPQGLALYFLPISLTLPEMMKGVQACESCASLGVPLASDHY